MHSTQRYVAYHVSHLLCATVRRGLIFALVIVAAFSVPTPVRAQAQELLFDGGFELGGVNWQISSTYTTANSGGWYLSAVGNPSPLTGLATNLAGPAAGLYVVSDQQATGTMALFQTFTVPSDASLTHLFLSFDMFVNDWSNQPTYNPNQHARVDITGATGTAHLAASIFNGYLGTDGGPLPNEFEHYEFDILPFVAQGQSYRVRFQTVVGVSQLNQGIDNVSVLAVPEPSTWMMTLAAATMIGGVLGRQRRRRRDTR
ncbi:MAG: PEP-CTERM sorting domain-containing protein [Pirellulales bacterium]